MFLTALCAPEPIPREGLGRVLVSAAPRAYPSRRQVGNPPTGSYLSRSAVCSSSSEARGVDVWLVGRSGKQVAPRDSMMAQDSLVNPSP